MVERPLKPVYLPLPDLQTAPIGIRLCFLRKRRGLTIPELSRLTGVSHNTISRIERSAAPLNPQAVGRILAYYGKDAREVFRANEDPFDQIIPPKDFGSWLKNLRLRRHLRQVELARILRVSKVTICRYERKHSRPDRAIRERLRKAFKLKEKLDKFL